MSLQRFVVDGREITFQPGETVMDAARSAGVAIPSLCHHRKTGILATCRICLVEVEGMEGMQVSCRLDARPGMKVATRTEAVLEARRTAVSLLFANGRHDCDRCEVDGECELQTAARDLGIERAPFVVPGEEQPGDESAPMIVRRPELCISCGRCVAACTGTVGHEVLAVGGRGETTRIICDDDRPMGKSSCVQCGECVQLCPTGAFHDRKSREIWRPDLCDQVETTCPYCGVGCGLTLHVDGKSGKVVRVTGTEGHPVSDGMLCVKGRYGWDFIHSEERLTTPLVKGADGSMAKASWEEAVELVAGRFRQLLKEHGPSAVAGLSSAKCTNEENYLFQKFFREVIGNSNVDHCARLCHSSTVTGMAAALGSGAMTNDLAGIASSDAILVIGSDTTAAHPVIAARIRQAVRRGGTKLIVIDPKRIALADLAHLYLRQRCGSDVAVINGLMHLIIREGWHDLEFIRERCEGFEELAASVASWTPERVEEISGIPSSQLKEAAALFGRAGRGAVFYAMGITQHISGTDNVRSLVNLQLLCGNFGKEGTGLNPLRGQCNVQGACDMGALPNVLPGYRPDPAPGMTAMEMVEAAGEGRLKALYVMGENPLLSDPDIGHVEKALAKLEFLVVQDIFPTETSRLADVVLPAACFAEKDGFFTNTERRVQRLRKAVAAPGEAREDWNIVEALARALGADWSYGSAAAIQEEIGREVPSYAGITWDRVGREGLQWPCTGPDHPGTPILHRESFPSGKGKMKAVHWRPPAEGTDGDYPFVLTTGRLLEQFHTGTMTRRCAGIDELAGPSVFINGKDAATLGVAEGETVEVSTRRGSLRAPARVTDTLGRGTIFIPFHFREAAANLLTIAALDPEAKIPEYKVCAARVEKVHRLTFSSKIGPA